MQRQRVRFTGGRGQRGWRREASPCLCRVVAAEVRGLAHFGDGGGACIARFSGEHRHPQSALPFDTRGSAIEDCRTDRKSTRVNCSHPSISYAVFCLKKKKITTYSTLCRYNMSSRKSSKYSAIRFVRPE